MEKRIIIIDKLTKEAAGIRRNSKLEDIVSFRSTPKLHSSGRRTSRHMIFLHPALGEIIGKERIGDQTFYQIAIVYGNGYIYDRTPNAYNPSTENIFIHEDEIDSFPNGNVVYHLIDIDLLSPRYLLTDKDGSSVAKDTRRFDLLAMKKHQQVVLDFGDMGSFFLDEITPTIEDKHKILGLAKHIASDNGINIINASQFLEEDYTDIEFDAYRIDLYRNVRGIVNVKFSEIQNFKDEFAALLNKYHVNAKKLNFEIDSETELHVLDLDEDEVQTYLTEKNLDINEILEKNRGFINGTKFGL